MNNIKHTHIYTVKSYNSDLAPVGFASLIGFEDFSHRPSFFCIFISIIILCLSSMTNKRVHSYRVSVHSIRVGEK